MRGDEHQPRLLHELCALLHAGLRSPFPLSPAAPAPGSCASRRDVARVSPSGFSLFLLGASLAMMLCGSVTFLIGFFLMPWVIGLLMLLYAVGVVSNLSGLGRAILCPNGPSIPKQVSDQLFSKLPVM